MLTCRLITEFSDAKLIVPLICSKIPFSKNLYYIETSQSIRISVCFWYHLYCYFHSRRKIKGVLRICKLVRISWICKNQKNVAEYVLLVCYVPFVLPTARINIINHFILTYPPWQLCERYFPLPSTFSNFSEFFYFPFFRWYVL